MPEILQHIDLGVHWYVGTKEKYDALTDIDPRGLYFITDQNQIYNRGKLFTRMMVLYDEGERPLTGAYGVIYFNKSTLEGFVFLDGEWKQCVAPIKDAKTIDEATTALVSNGQIAIKIADYFMAIAKSKLVTDIEYDEDRREIIFTRNNNKIDAGLLIGTKLAFDMDTLNLKLSSESGHLLSSVKINDNFVIGGSYDDKRKAIIFQMRDGSECRLAARDLLKLYSGVTTKTTTSTVHNYIDGRNVLSTFVRISAGDEDGNFIKVREAVDENGNTLIFSLGDPLEGLYAKQSIDTLADIKENELYKANSYGAIVKAEVLITDLATEEYVYDIIKGASSYLKKMEDIYLKQVDVSTSIPDDETTASTSKAPSFNAFNSYCGFKRL